MMCKYYVSVQYTNQQNKYTLYKIIFQELLFYKALEIDPQ